MKVWIIPSAILLILSLGLAAWFGRRETQSGPSVLEAPAVALEWETSGSVELPGTERAARAPLDQHIEPNPRPEPADTTTPAESMRVRKLLAGWVLGRVIDERGDPVTSFTVEALEPLTGQSKIKRFENGRGSFELEHLSRGRWVFVVTAADRLRRRREVEVPCFDLVEIVAPSVGTIEVTVVDVEGRPLTGATVAARYSSDRPFDQWIREVTDALGRATLDSVMMGRCQVSAELAGLATSISKPMLLSPIEPRVELTLVMSQGGTVTGELMDVLGQPAEGIRLSLHGARETDLGEVGMALYQRAQVGADGIFTFEHVAAGTWSLHTRAEAADLERVPEQGLELLVREGQVTHVIFKELHGSSVQVRGLVLRNGEPVRGARVSLAWQKFLTSHTSREAETDATGHFEMTLDEGGDYLFRISEDGDGEDGGTVSLHATIPSIPTYELKLAYSTGSISGRVFAAGGEPAPGVNLTIMGGSLAGSVPGTAVQGRSADSGGAYEFPHLLPGTYELSAGGACYRGTSLRTGGDPLWGGATREVVVRAGQAQDDVDLDLSLGSAIEGVVTINSETPAIDARVQCVAAGPKPIWPMRWGVVTDGIGAFHCDGLAPGEYWIRGILGEDVAPWTLVRTEAGRVAHIDQVIAPGALVTCDVRGFDPTPGMVYIQLVDKNGIVSASGAYSGLPVTLGPVVPGTYRVLASQGTGTPDERELEQSLSIAAEAEQSVHLQFP